MGEMAQFLKDVVEYNIKKMVDRPEDVKVGISVSTKSVIVQIDINLVDFGKVIGKNGKNIDALRTICLASKNTKFPGDSRRISLEVLEDENSSFSYK